MLDAKVLDDYNKKRLHHQELWNGAAVTNGAEIIHISLEDISDDFGVKVLVRNLVLATK